MNGDFLNEIDQTALDRLVDGELSRQERQRLLAGLDSQPDGWRRCALAFLEAQAWQSDLAGLPGEGHPSEAVQQRAAGSAGVAMLWLSVAASLLLAFGMGVVAQRNFWNADPNTPTTPLAEQNETIKNKSKQTVLEKPIVQPSGRMTLVVGDDQSGKQEIELPVYDADKLDQQWMNPPELPVEFLQALENSGHEVRHSRQYIPFPLEDGRSVVVPIEQVDIVPVGRVIQ